MIRIKVSLFLLICASLLSFSAKGQEIDIIVKGILVDSLSSKFIAGATVKIMDGNDVIKQDRVANNGLFFLRMPKNKSIEMVFTHVNYGTKKIFIPSRDTGIDLGIVYLSVAGNILDTTMVMGRRPTIIRKIDRIEFNVQNDPDKDISNVLDMLQKVPLINVDGQDKISLKGKTNFKLLINGRSSALFSGDPGIALKMMPSKDILKIEVITSPPSKYDAEGVGGLINIVTKRKMDDGYDIYFGASYNFTYGPLGSFSTNVKVNKLQLSVLATTFFQRTPYNTVDKIIDFANGDNIEQHGEQKFKGNSSMVRGQLLYEMDTLNTWSLSGSWKIDKFDMMSRIVSQQGDISDYTVFQQGEPFWKVGDIDLNYQRGFRRNSKELLNLSYKFSSSSNAIKDNLRYQGNDWSARSQYNEFGFKENSVQIDYETQGKDLLIESGGKFIARNSNSHYKYDLQGPDNFEFDYNVFNLYQTVGYEKRNWSYKGGVRMDVMTFAKKDYSQGNKFNLLPSLAIQRSFKEYHTLGATYNARIQRANIAEISPFVDRSNPSFMLSGNPDLVPTKVHNFNLSYTYINKLSLITDLGYSYTNNSIQQVYNARSDSLIYISYENLGKGSSVDANANIGYTFKKIKWSFNGRLSYVNMEGLNNDLSLRNGGYEGNASLNAAIPFSSTFRTNVSVRYTGPRIFLQGRSNAYLGTSVSLTKQLMAKRLSIFASINNPFYKYFTRRTFFSVPEFSTMSLNRQNYRIFVLSASYSFGSLNLKQKKINKKVDNSDQNKFEINPLK